MTVGLAALRLLERRFGPLAPELRDRLAGASTAQLNDWAERVLSAQSAAEALATGPRA